MPIKLGKSKSSSGSEFNTENSPTIDDSGIQQKKNKGIRRLLDRAKLSKIPTHKSSVKSNDDNIIKYKHKTSEISNDNFSNNSPILSSSSHSVSPKLYLNSCASSIEELSNVTNTNNLMNSNNCQTNITCSPIQDVILEEDYEEALLLNNRPQIVTKSSDKKANYETNGNESSKTTNSKQIPQSIYNEPSDTIHGSDKEIIESCRLSQITPTNQFKEIRSRSGCDADPLIVHPDVGVGGWSCSTNSSSVGSAHTLSESPAVAPTVSVITSSSSTTSSTSASPLNPISCSIAKPTSITISNLTIDINANNTTNNNNNSDGNISSTTTTTTTTNSNGVSYANSPKGNTVICHHPASPFAPPSQSSSTNSSTTVKSNNCSASSSPLQTSSTPLALSSSDSTSTTNNNNNNNNNNSDINTNIINTHIPNNSNLISRRPGRFNKTAYSNVNTTNAPAFSDTVQTAPTVSSTNNTRAHLDSLKASERRSEYYSKHPLYEEAWDVKMHKMCQEIVVASNKDVPPPTASTHRPSLVIQQSSIVSSINRPQSAVGGRTDNSKYSSPPAVPPHRRSSGHFRLVDNNLTATPNLSNNVDIKELSNGHKLKSNTKYSINPTFTESKEIGVKEVATEINDSTSASAGSCDGELLANSAINSSSAADYDYAYNETWSLGVKLNMNLNLSNDALCIDNNRITSTLPTAIVTDPVSTNSTTATATAANATIISGQSNSLSTIDNDSSLSNDSYEEPWDVRHGRVISELTSARLIDPACIRTTAATASPVATGVSSASAINGKSNIISSTAATSSSFIPTAVVNDGHNAQQTQRNRSISGSRSATHHQHHPQHQTTLINTNVILEDQPWYHDECTRSNAERMLDGSREGSFLVRKSETCRNTFSLSIKHRNEILHMKISHNTRGYILGQYSQPYVSVPHMLHHYSLTMVPVRGAESVQLCFPVARQCVNATNTSVISTTATTANSNNNNNAVNPINYINNTTTSISNNNSSVNTNTARHSNL